VVLAKRWMKSGFGLHKTWRIRVNLQPFRQDAEPNFSLLHRSVQIGCSLATGL
jgi:hypothetical protein